MAKKKAVKKKATKKGKARGKKYETKLAIVGSLDDVLKVSVASAEKKK